MTEKIEIVHVGRNPDGSLSTPLTRAADAEAARLAREKGGSAADHYSAALGRVVTASPDVWEQHVRLNDSMSSPETFAALPLGERLGLEALGAFEAQQIRKAAETAETATPFEREIERQLADHFGGDRAHYLEAAQRAAKARPDLFEAWHVQAEHLGG